MKIAIEREKLQALFDLAINSMNFSSGFWDDEEVRAARSVAELLGVCPQVATPANFLGKFPACKFTTGRLNSITNEVDWYHNDKACQDARA